MASVVEVIAILAGVILGAVVARHRHFFRPAATPFLSLLATLRPLVLPLFAVVIVGLVKFPAWVTVLVGTTLTLIAVSLILRPEALALKAEGELLKTVGKHAAWLALVAGVLGLVLNTVLSTNYFDSIGGTTAFFLVLGLLLWLLAFLLRFVSYASSWLRAFVALALVLTGLRWGAAVGVAPEGKWISENASWLDIALPAAAVALLLLEATLDVIDPWLAGRAIRGQPTPPIFKALLRIRSTALQARPVRISAGLGAATALLAAFALAVSAIGGLDQTVQPGETLATESATIAGEEPAPGAPGRFATDLALAKAYTPVLALTGNERWSPTSVDPYVRRAVLSGPMKEPLANPRSVDEKLDRTCPRLASSPCFRLSIQCKSGEEEECSEAHRHSERNSEGLYREGDVYVRVIKKPVEEEEERRLEAEHLRSSDRWRPKVFVDEGPYRKSLTTLIQYWYFYPYDEWEARVFAGQLIQRHESDWEAVTVGLSEQRPLFVAYSAHCAGSWKPWSAVTLSDKFLEPTHPLVAVAEGSHANYPDAKQQHSPDWAHCQGAPAGTVSLLSYASNIRDKTEYGWQWYPPAHGWKLVDYETLPMNFPGYWGADESTTLVGYFKETQLGKGHGPKTPSEQPLWMAPVTKIFCENYDGPQGDYYCKEK